MDYVRDAGEAEKVKEQYGLIITPADKNLVIFDAGDKRVKIRPGDALVQKQLEQENPKIQNKRTGISNAPVAFNGELMFTSMLLALENAQAVQGLFSAGRRRTVADRLRQLRLFEIRHRFSRENYITVTNLELSAARDVPDGLQSAHHRAGPPAAPLAETELQKIDQYLAQGGRLFALFNYTSINSPTGLNPFCSAGASMSAADHRAGRAKHDDRTGHQQSANSASIRWWIRSLATTCRSR